VQQVANRRNPRTSATVDELLSRYFEQFPGAPTTLDLYRTHARNHISPVVGQLKVGRLDPETLDSFYAELRRCRRRCRGRKRTIDHRETGDHECTERCRPHVCRPLAQTTIRQIHFILSGAYKKAVRWGWVGENPTAKAEPPPAPKPNPQPPSAEQAARIVVESWHDPDWGALVWTAMTTGIRRGELCAIRLSSIDLGAGRETLWLRKAIRRDPDDRWIEADLKTHQQRRIALDSETVTVLGEYIDQRRAQAAKVDIELDDEAYMFSTTVDGSDFLTPDSVTQRYDRMATRLGIETTLHKLRHYSATELITAGVDPRTVAGRLGHGGGGTTTLRTYTAWVSEADQRAAHSIAARMPTRPRAGDDRNEPKPCYPYEVVAEAVRRRIADGALPSGSSAPRAVDLASQHGVSLATAKRGLALLIERGELKRESRGVLLVVAPRSLTPAAAPVAVAAQPHGGASAGRLLHVTVQRRSLEVARFSTVVDPHNAAALNHVLVNAVIRNGGFSQDIGEYEMDLREPNDGRLLLTFVASFAH
jgi:integrase